MGPRNQVLDGSRYHLGKGQLLGFLADRKAWEITTAVYAAKGIIQSSITARHAMRPFIRIL